ncbi:TIGR00270 family protein [Candidatus Woesearchaeota archaeon]|jgi:uncharacterized protein (TIGR00270 family)|nr:TIGR00270 family protein [Candidatus Woesearchaeota archaeon]
MNCDICGSKGELFNVEMEGSKLVACDKCAVYGKKINKVVVNDEPVINFRESKKFVKADEPVILVVDNYNSLIKNKREKLGLKQEDLAKSINEKESLIQQIENKKIEPSFKVAEKLEKRLGLILLENYKESVSGQQSLKDQGPVTLGDLIQFKTRKKK